VSRTSNLTFQPGSRDLAGLMADAKTGLLITSMFGPSLNGNTGDWSVGCSGFWFEDGEIAYPVNEITVAGNLIDIFARDDPRLGPGDPRLGQCALDPGGRPGHRRPK
jgi:PmbA protein